jgi:aminoglycoside phosphotransferase family enzyme
MKPEAYDEDPGHIELTQTHISFVFLTSNNLVYKVKKAVDLGFLDFTTLEKRRFFCQKELELNRRLCGDMYLEVVPINRSNVIRIKGEGKTIEYAVKMKKMPQEKMMNKLLEEKPKIDNRQSRISIFFKKVGQGDEDQDRNRCGFDQVEDFIRQRREPLRPVETRDLEHNAADQEEDNQER